MKNKGLLSLIGGTLKKQNQIKTVNRKVGKRQSQKMNKQSATHRKKKTNNQ
jgi:hypothetical protein